MRVDTAERHEPVRLLRFERGLAESPVKRLSPLLAFTALCLAACIVFACPAFADGGDWSSFRPTSDNNAVVDAPTPTTPQHTALRWARTFGTGWSDSPTPPILVDGKLIEITGQTIREVDPATGKTLRANKALKGTPSFSYTPPTYADGVIYVPLAGIASGNKKVAGIQAINAKTLESEWVYKASEQGQNWVAPAVKDGLVYAGFYSSDTAEAHFVCLRTKADGRSKAGALVWSHSTKGGFYWSNPLIVGSSVVVGTGDGTPGDSGTGHLLSLDRRTGTVVSDARVAGDVHATAVHDVAGGYVFVTTTPGWLYRFKVNAKTGALSQSVRVRVGNHCTTTPVVYGGRVYVGTNSGFASGQLACIGTNDMRVKYAVDLGGPMQSSPVLSAGHLAQTGKVTLYCTINNANRGLVAVTVAPDATRATQAKVAEIYDEAGHEQYGICSPIVSPEGTIYYKNDSGTLFAVGSTDDAAHARVVSLIERIGTVDKNSKAKISAARTAYNALPEAARAAIPNYSALLQAERAYASLPASKRPTMGKAAGRKAKARTMQGSGKAVSRTASKRNVNRKPEKPIAVARCRQNGVATRTGAGAVSPHGEASVSALGHNRATIVGLPVPSALSGERTGRIVRGAGAPAHKNAGATPGAKAASKTKVNAHSAKAHKSAADEDPPAATAALPSAEADNRVPSWTWLAVIALAAAALLVLLWHRRRSLREGD